MKNITKEILGFNVPIIGVVETLSEAVAAAGSEEAVLADYVSNVLAHSHYAIVRRKIVDVLEKETGVRRNGEGDGDKFKVTEKDAEYIARLETELGEETLKGLEAKIAEEVGKIPVDYKPSQRGAGGSAAPAKKWLAAYDQLVAEEKLDAFLSKYGIDATEMDEETLKITVANKVKEVVTAHMKAAQEAALAV